ncbi:MAG: PilZ domain-containing protein [Myxococcales bacterium]|nr:PilZ domain-containing protein [Myxococcales bacterium]
MITDEGGRDALCLGDESSTDEPQHLRRAQGARRQSSEPVELHGDGRVVTGWTLNLSRGGARLVLDGSVEVGESFELVVGDYALPEVPARHGVKVVWVNSDREGCVTGVAFDDAGSVPPPPFSNSVPPPGFGQPFDALYSSSAPPPIDHSANAAQQILAAAEGLAPLRPPKLPTDEV